MLYESSMHLCIMLAKRTLALITKKHLSYIMYSTIQCYTASTVFSICLEALCNLLIIIINACYYIPTERNTFDSHQWVRQEPGRNFPKER